MIWPSRYFSQSLLTPSTSSSVRLSLIILVRSFSNCTCLGSFFYFVGYREIVSMLLRAANSQEQLKRVLDSFDIDGDTVYISLPLLNFFTYNHRES